MTEKFKIGQRVIAVEDANDLSIGDIGTIHSIDSIYVDVKLDKDTEEFPWLHHRFKALDEYPMDYTTAFKALIDGKVVEDKQGCVLRFSKVDMRFQCRTKNGKFYTMDTVPNNEKFKEYVVVPKFTIASIVEYDNEYARIIAVNDNGSYEITMQPSTYKGGRSGDNITVEESELTEVQ